jgi:uncharacterized protein with beta-barrel porin domain
MRGKRRGGRSGRRLLLASSSVAALLIGGGAPPAFAACKITLNGGTVAAVTNATTANCIFIENNAIVTGNVTNAGTGVITATGTTAPTATGITINNSSIGGAVSNAGTITALDRTGIKVDNNATVSGGIVNSGTISAGSHGIHVSSVSTFAGNISNSGTISAAHYGIDVSNVAVFGSSAGGGISNSGTISAGTSGISVQLVSTFAGNISNSGMISAVGEGIAVVGVSNFAGNIINSGTISAGGEGIAVPYLSTFTGNISNSGTILAGGYGIVVQLDSTFAGNISNSGTISAGGYGIIVGGFSTFAGNISNSGTISASGYGIVVSGATAFLGGISNSGKITATSGTGIYVADVSTFSGNISNSGTITAKTGINIFNNVSFAAGAAVVNSGIITGTGGTAINIASAAGAVTVDQNAGTITGAIKLISTDDTLNVSGGVINGNIVGRGAGGGGVINFTLGAGNTFTYAAPYGFSGFDQVNIESGTAVLNGVNSAANIVVGSSLGGTLAGAGTMDALAVTINAGGTLAPGPVGGIGTMTINGNLQFFAGSTYRVTIAPASNSKTQDNGTATLGGATVQVAPLAGTYGPHTYTILTDTGGTIGVGNSFAGSVTSTRGILIDPVLSYDADDAYLTIQGVLFTLDVPANAPTNVQNVANAIDQFIIGGGTPPAGFQNLFNYTPAQLGNALTQLEGQPATGAQTSAFQLMTDFMNLLSDPSSAGGGSPTGGGAPGFAPEQEASLPSDIAQAYAAILTKAPPQQQSFEQRWSAWGSAYGGAAKLDGNPVVGSGDVTASDYGFAAGMDYRATPDSVYGFALAGGGTNWSVAGNLGTGRSDSFQVGVHDTTHWGPFYLSGALAFANHWFTTSRIAVGDQLTAKFDGQSYAARGEAGYRYAVPVTSEIIGVTPYAAVQVQDFHTPNFSETDLSGGGLGLSFASQNATDTRSELGARFDNVQIVNAMPLVLRARIAWAHDWISNPSLGAVFQALPGSNFTVSGAAPPQNSALTSASAELHLTTNWSAIAKFDGEFAQTAQTYAGTGTLRYSW